MPFPLIPLAVSGLSALGGALFGKGSSNSGSGVDLASLLNSLPELRNALSLQTQQAQRQDPLHAALTQLALNFLPRGAFTSIPGRPQIAGNDFYSYGSNIPSSVTPYAIGAARQTPPSVPSNNSRDNYDEDRRKI